MAGSSLPCGGLLWTCGGLLSQEVDRFELPSKFLKTTEILEDYTCVKNCANLSQTKLLTCIIYVRPRQYFGSLGSSEFHLGLVYRSDMMSNVTVSHIAVIMGCVAIILATPRGPDADT